jgi:transposase-like protein
MTSEGASGQDPFDGEVKRRTEVVGIFPNEAAFTRLV